MKFNDVRNQLAAVYLRAIESGVSAAQNNPKIVHSGLISIGNLKSTAISLKDLPYQDIYNDLVINNQYHLKLIDGALLLFQYNFDSNGLITKHRLSYFPCPKLPSVEDAPDLYRKDNIYGDLLLNKIVRFPIRFDYDPINYKPTIHSHSHMTLGQFDNCRIPASHPLSPNSFFTFIIRNFYYNVFIKKQNIFEKNITKCPATVCITPSESKLISLSIGI